MEAISKMMTIFFFGLSIALFIVVGFIPAMVTLALAATSLKWAVAIDYR